MTTMRLPGLVDAHVHLREPMSVRCEPCSVGGFRHDVELHDPTDAGSRNANASYRPRGKMKACHFQIRIVLGFAVEGIDADAANGGRHHGIRRIDI